jgi:tetratricopeptide (TPR) repeat protein
VTRSADPEDPQIGMRLHELAGAEQAATLPQQAVAHLREALALHTRHYGERHPLTLSTEGELAAALSDVDGLVAAEPLFRRDIALRGEVFGADHVAVAAPLNNYAVALYMQHRYADAAPLFERAWKVWEKSLGADHANTRSARANYAGALAELGRDAEAEPILRQALADARRLDPPGTLTPKYNTLALALERGDRLAEAEAVLREGLANDVSVHAGNEIKYPWTRTLLGRVLRERGDLADAREQLEKALAAYDADDFPDGPKTATCLVELARVRSAQAAPPAALRPLLERALAAQEAKLGRDAPDSTATRAWLGRLPR